MADGSLPSPSALRPIRAVDLFCGAGGTSTGAARAVRSLGRYLDLAAVNHWPLAIETHQRNHPSAAHHCVNLEHAHPLDIVPGGRLDLLMASPSCTHHSPARGGKPVHDQQRIDPWHVVRWCTELRVTSILVENVPAIQSWGPCDTRTGRPIASKRGTFFRAWCSALEGIGYSLDWRILNCADYGDPTTRERFFLIARNDRKRLEWPEATHSREGVVDLLGARPRWRGVEDVIDWTLPAASIFTRARPLVRRSLQRILNGAERAGWPAAHRAAIAALVAGDVPELRTDLADGTAAVALIAPYYGSGSGETCKPVTLPLDTVTTKGRFALVIPVVENGRVDVRYRMLHWRELARAMSFDDGGESYAFEGNTTEIIRQIGNAVPGRTAQALVRSLLASTSGR